MNKIVSCAIICLFLLGSYGCSTKHKRYDIYQKYYQRYSENLDISEVAFIVISPINTGKNPFSPKSHTLKLKDSSRIRDKKRTSNKKYMSGDIIALPPGQYVVVAKHNTTEWAVGPKYFEGGKCYILNSYPEIVEKKVLWIKQRGSGRGFVFEQKTSIDDCNVVLKGIDNVTIYKFNESTRGYKLFKKNIVVTDDHILSSGKREGFYDSYKITGDLLRKVAEQSY